MSLIWRQCRVYDDNVVYMTTMSAIWRQCRQYDDNVAYMTTSSHPCTIFEYPCTLNEYPCTILEYPCTINVMCQMTENTSFWNVKLFALVQNLNMVSNFYSIQNNPAIDIPDSRMYQKTCFKQQQTENTAWINRCKPKSQMSHKATINHHNNHNC